MITDDPKILNCYTSKFVSELAHRFDIQKPAEIQSLQYFLYVSATRYFEIKKETAAKISSNRIRAQIRSIRNLAEKLNSKLSELSEPAAELIWTPQRHLRIQPFDDTNSKSPFGHTIIRQRTDPNIETINYLKEDQIREAIEIIRNLAGYALTHRNKGGHPKAEAIWIWVANAQIFWEITLGRSFTHHGYDNIGKSKAYIFCWEALSVLDPTIQPKALSTAMRAVIGIGHIEIDKEGRLHRSTRKNRPKK